MSDGRNEWLGLRPKGIGDIRRASLIGGVRVTKEGQ